MPRNVSSIRIKFRSRTVFPARTVNTTLELVRKAQFYLTGWKTSIRTKKERDFNRGAPVDNTNKKKIERVPVNRPLKHGTGLWIFHRAVIRLVYREVLYANRSLSPTYRLRARSGGRWLRGGAYLSSRLAVYRGGRLAPRRGISPCNCTFRAGRVNPHPPNFDRLECDTHARYYL